MSGIVSAQRQQRQAQVAALGAVNVRELSAQDWERLPAKGGRMRELERRRTPYTNRSCDQAAVPSRALLYQSDRYSSVEKRLLMSQTSTARQGLTYMNTPAAHAKATEVRNFDATIKPITCNMARAVLS